MSIKEIYDNFYNEFHQDYYSFISKELKMREEVRKSLYSSIRGMIIFAIFSLVLFAVLGFTYKLITIEIVRFISVIIMCVSILIVLVLYTVINGQVFDFAKNLKNDLMPLVLNSLKGVRYVPDGISQYINEQSLRQHGFKTLHQLDKVRSSREQDFQFSKDFFRGDRNGVEFECVEHFGNYVYVSFELNKAIKNQVVVATKEIVVPSFFRFDFGVNDINAILIPVIFINIAFFVFLFIAIGWFVILFFIAYVFVIYFLMIGAQQGVFKSLKQVVLEDVEFNKQFMVFSNDEIDARYLATPAFMERFKSMQLAFCAKNIKCSVLDNRILFVIKTTKNLFELGNIFSPIDNSKLVKEVFNQISSIMLMIDHFKLDEKTGL